MNYEAAVTPKTPKRSRKDYNQNTTTNMNHNVRSNLNTPSKQAPSQSTSRIKVFLRVRPPQIGEDDLGVESSNTEEVLLKYGGTNEKWERRYQFDGVFGPSTSQTEIYGTVASDTVRCVFEGYHSLLLAYGPTGSGKTYTVSNRLPTQEGILVQAVRQIFSTISRDLAHHYTCTLQVVQLYNEVFTDLLSSADTRIQLRDDSEVEHSVHLQGACAVAVGSEEECMSFLNMSEERRASASTLRNKQSSRSHTIYQITVLKDGQEGRLILVDLAGSERLKRAGLTGQRVAEAKYINTSLLVLGRVVQALSDPNSPHVPFRESKLTRLLQYALSGNGKTSMVIAVGPSQRYVDESEAAIQFGQRAMRVKQNPKIQKPTDYRSLVNKLQEQIQQQSVLVMLGQKYLHKMKSQQAHIEDLTCEVSSLSSLVKVQSETLEAHLASGGTLSEDQSTMLSELYLPSPPFTPNQIETPRLQVTAPTPDPTLISQTENDIQFNMNRLQQLETQRELLYCQNLKLEDEIKQSQLKTQQLQSLLEKEMDIYSQIQQSIELEKREVQKVTGILQWTRQKKKEIERAVKLENMELEAMQENMRNSEIGLPQDSDLHKPKISTSTSPSIHLRNSDSSKSIDKEPNNIPNMQQPLKRIRENETTKDLPLAKRSSIHKVVSPNQTRKSLLESIARHRVKEKEKKSNWPRWWPFSSKPR